MNPHPLAKPALRPSSGGRYQVLRDLLRSRRRLLVLTHNNPDPDSLGGAVGLREFARLVTDVPCSIGITGKILRAENKAMVSELGIELEQLADVDLSAFDCFALVDTQPGFGHTFVPPNVTVDIVIDHHVCDDATVGPDDVPFFEVRPEVGATSSIVAGLLLEAGVKPSAQAATAMAYGLRTDTADLSRNVSDLDQKVAEFLGPLIDRKALVAITNPRLPLAYFQALKQALEKARLYDGLTLCSLGHTASAEMVAEVADMLLRMEGVRAVFCGGQVGNSYYVSVRTEAGQDAWTLIRAALEGEKGSCGGHGSVAGGSVALDAIDTRSVRRLERRLERNVLRALGASGGNAATIGARDD